MKKRKEKLGREGAIKGTMLNAHLAWVAEKVPDASEKLRPHLGPECLPCIDRAVLATDWVPFRCIVEVDKAIAAVVGGVPDDVYRELGKRSAILNLGGVYKGFVVDEPHRFFEQMALLHSRFQSFGRSFYERTGERSGRIGLEGYDEYSPVYCTSALGYFVEALQLMKVPGPARGHEVSCQCAGDRACVYELSW